MLPTSPSRSAISSVEHRAARIAETPLLDRLARLGLMCRGVLHLVIGGVALRLALGQTRRAVGWKESVVQVSHLGTLPLLVFAFGLIGYGVWRAVQAVADTERKGRSLRGTITRVSFVLDGLTYVGLAIVACELLLGRSVDVREHTAHDVGRFLLEPHGRVLVGGASIVIAVSAVTHFIEVVRAKFAEDFPREALSKPARVVAIAIGRVGIAARGVVFTLMSWSLARAAFHVNAREAHGVEGSLEHVAWTTTHAAWLEAVGVGLMTYALFCFVYARYRRIAPA